MAKFDPENPAEVIKCGFMKLGRQYVTDVIEMNAFEEISKYEGPVLTGFVVKFFQTKLGNSINHVLK